MKYSSASGTVRVHGAEASFTVAEDGNVYLSTKLESFDKAVEWLKGLEGEVAQPPVEKPAKKAKPEPVVEAVPVPVPAPIPEPVPAPVVEVAPEPVKLPEPVQVVAAIVEPQIKLFAPPAQAEVADEEPEQDDGDDASDEGEQAPAATDGPAPKRRGRPKGSKNKTFKSASDKPSAEPKPPIPLPAFGGDLLSKILSPAKIEEAKKANDVGLVIRRVLKLETTSFPIEVRPAELGWTATCPQLPDLQGFGTNETDAVNDLRMAIADWHGAMQKQAAKAAEAAAAGVPVEPEPIKLTPRNKHVTIHPTPEAAQAIPPVYDSLEDLGDECVKCQSPGEAVRLAIFFHFDNNPEHLSKPYEGLLKYTAAYMTSVWPRVPALQGKKIRSAEKQLDLARTYLDQYLRVKNGKSPVGNDEE